MNALTISINDKAKSLRFSEALATGSTYSVTVNGGANAVGASAVLALQLNGKIVAAATLANGAGTLSTWTQEMADATRDTPPTARFQAIAVIRCNDAGEEQNVAVGYVELVQAGREWTQSVTPLALPDLSDYPTLTELATGLDEIRSRSAAAGQAASQAALDASASGTNAANAAAAASAASSSAQAASNSSAEAQSFANQAASSADDAAVSAADAEAAASAASSSAQAASNSSAEAQSFANQAASSADDAAVSAADAEAAARAAETASQGRFLVVQELPDAEDADPKSIYLVPRWTPEQNNGYDEWLVVDDGLGAKSWEKIGSTDIDLSGYVPTTRKINNKPLTGDVTLTGADIAVSSTDATKINAAIGNKLDKSGGEMTGQLRINQNLDVVPPLRVKDIGLLVRFTRSGEEVVSAVYEARGITLLDESDAVVAALSLPTTSGTLALTSDVAALAATVPNNVGRTATAVTFYRTEGGTSTSLGWSIGLVNSAFNFAGLMAPADKTKLDALPAAATIPLLYTAIQQIAPAFDPTRTQQTKYPKNAIVSKDGAIYRCVNSNGHYGEWVENNWTATPVSELFLPVRGGEKIDDLVIRDGGIKLYGSDSSYWMIYKDAQGIYLYDGTDAYFLVPSDGTRSGGGTFALTAGTGHADNLAALDAQGNPTDSGVKASDKLDASSASAPFSSDSSVSYAVGEHCTYNGKLYKCTTATTGGTWVAASWTVDDMTTPDATLDVTAAKQLRVVATDGTVLWAQGYDLATTSSATLANEAVNKYDFAVNATDAVSLTLPTPLSGKVGDFVLDVTNPALDASIPGPSTFSASNTYAEGDVVWYPGASDPSNNKIYRCTTAVETAGEWTGSTNWEEALPYLALSGLGTLFSVVVPANENLTDMLTFAPNAMAELYFTQTSFTVGNLPTWKIVRQDVEAAV